MGFLGPALSMGLPILGGMFGQGKTNQSNQNQQQGAIQNWMNAIKMMQQYMQNNPSPFAGGFQVNPPPGMQGVSPFSPGGSGAGNAGGVFGGTPPMRQQPPHMSPGQPFPIERIMHGGPPMIDRPPQMNPGGPGGPPMRQIPGMNGGPARTSFPPMNGAPPMLQPPSMNGGAPRVQGPGQMYPGGSPGGPPMVNGMNGAPPMIGGQGTSPGMPQGIPPWILQMLMQRFGGGAGGGGGSFSPPFDMGHYGM